MYPGRYNFVTRDDLSRLSSLVIAPSHYSSPAITLGAVVLITSAPLFLSPVFPRAMAIETPLVWRSRPGARR